MGQSEISVLVISIGVMIFLAHLFAFFFTRKKVPDVLLLMIVGIIIGPVTHLFDPARLGVVGPLLSTVTLVIILFEGGTDLRLESIRSGFKGSAALTIFNFLFTLLGIGLFSFFCLHLTAINSLMLGAILGATSSAVVIPIVKWLSISENSRTMLVLESALSDVLSIVCALVFVEAARFGSWDPGLMIGKLFSSMLMALLIGFGGGILWAYLLHRIRTIQNSMVTTPAFVFLIFGVAELLGYSGAITALAFGIVLANTDHIRLPFLERRGIAKPMPLNENEMSFFRELVFILKTFFFVYLGMSLKFSDWRILLTGFIITLIIFVIRIPVVRFFIKRTGSKRDRAIVAMIAPKGLASAVLASIPAQLGIPQGDVIRDVTYAVVFFSIIITSLLVLVSERSTTIVNIYSWFVNDTNSNNKTEPSSGN